MIDVGWCDTCKNWVDTEDGPCPVCKAQRERDEALYLASEGIANDLARAIRERDAARTDADTWRDRYNTRTREREEARDLAVEMSRCLNNFIYGCQCGVPADLETDFLRALVKKAEPWLKERAAAGRIRANEPLDGLDLVLPGEK